MDHLAHSGEALVLADAIAAKVLERAPQATKVAKMLINAADSEDSERVLEALAGRIAAGSDELQEGLAAFREKRSPDFS